MPVTRLALTALLALLALLPAAAQTVPAPESQRLAQELRQLIGPARCSSDSQCRVLPVGAKACGGPAAYWAWSTQGTDEKRLTELAARQAEAQRHELQASGRLSNCALVTAPAVACVAQTCQIQARPAGDAS
jgi:hypothetical protein